MATDTCSGLCLNGPRPQRQWWNFAPPTDFFVSFFKAAEPPGGMANPVPVGYCLGARDCLELLVIGPKLNNMHNAPRQ